MGDTCYAMFGSLWSGNRFRGGSRTNGSSFQHPHQRPRAPGEGVRGARGFAGPGRGAPRHAATNVNRWPSPNTQQYRQPQAAGCDKFTLARLAGDAVEPAEIIRILTRNIDEILLNHANDFDYLEHVFLALGQFCKKNGCTQFTDGFVVVVQALASNKIFSQVPSVILHIPTSYAQKHCSAQQRIELFLQSIYWIGSQMLIVMPDFGCNFLGKNFFVDVMAMKSFPSIRSLGADQAFDSLEPGNALLMTAWEQNVQDDTSTRVNRRELEIQARLELTSLHKPPNDFRTLNILPNMEDMFGEEEPFLRPNIVKGKYPDAATYLDVQFRLLREDFFQPLRIGLQAYANRSNYNKQTRRMENVRFYHNVKLMGYETESNSYTIQFAVKSLGRISWETSKRLIHGSLIVLSSDEFRSFHVFTVADRKPDQLARGEFKAKFEGDDLPKNYRRLNYVMAESTIFFEAYRSVLWALQKISPDQFPLKDYILGHTTDGNLPDYLLNRGVEVPYNVYYDQVPYTSWNIPENVDIFERVREDNLQKANILNVEARPSAAELGLDESQHEAYFAALTQKVAVIQGPPGTGKTYLGLRIVRTLLKNSLYWRNGQSTPILVICYTNHALDQFLEGIADFTQNIVRVGGQSKCEALEKYSLYQRKRTNRQIISSYTRNWIAETQEKIKTIHLKLDMLRHFLYQIQTGHSLVHETSFSKMGVMPKELGKKFKCFRQKFFPKFSPGQGRSVLTLWLGLETRLEFLYTSRNLFSTFYQQSAATHQTDAVDDSKKDDQLEKPIEDEGWDKEDIEAVQAERLISDMDGDDLLEFIRRDCRGIQSAFHQIQADVDDMDEAYRSCYNVFAEYKAIEKLREDLKSIDEGQEQAEIIMWQIKEREWFANSLKRLLLESTPASDEEIGQWTKNGLEAVSWDKRWKMYAAWKRKTVKLIEERITNLEKKGQNLVRQLAAIRDKESAEICKTADVVGLTTTGASKHRAFVDHLKPKIVMVEEAAEVLEAHIVTSLSSSCQHLILIGDHQQLRPPVSVYKLAKDYQLDVSLFERLIKNGMKPSVLGVQHRMRPDIARLIVPAIYPTLENHSSVLEYPSVKGMRENVFFLSHTEQEMADHEGRSHLNVYEANMCLALARYLLVQGYNANQITILTTYSGQLLHFRKLRRDQALLRPIRISVVDNFQGEENDIIILSLVRSNPDESIGFLRIDNRICVALSRAKHGFFVLGNMQMLQGKSKLWAEISKLLESKGQLGAKVPLICEKHDKSMEVGQADQFPPEGGCFEMCSEPMKCGHICPKLCHANYDPGHKEVKCMVKCSRTCPEGHPCSKLCKDPCPDCQIRVRKLLPCTHEEDAPCYKPAKGIFCTTVLWKILPDCGHGLDLACGIDVSKVKCQDTCGQLLDCGHVCPKTCHVKSGNKHNKSECQEPCQRTCTAEHPCQKKCGEECGDCRVQMMKMLPCGHETQLACCKNPDTAYCHVKVQKVLSDCQHYVEIECSQSTDNVKCTEQCQRMLCADGHPCNKKCFQPCGRCNRRVERELQCGHTLALQCHIDPAIVKCPQPKEAKLPACGHVATIKCGEDPAQARCSMKCDIRLECGHTCVMNCHSNNDPNHENYICRKQCSRLKTGCKMNHKCGRKCFEKCPPCNKKWTRTLPCGHTIFTECKHDDSEIFCSVVVKKTVAECGHEVQVECSRLPTLKDCAKPCVKVLNCGHKCAKKCSEPCNSNDCKQLVSTSMTSSCGHDLKLECSVFTKQGLLLTEVQKKEYLMSCQEPCKKLLDCGHPCRGTCGVCFNGRVHLSCQQDCGRTLICGHACKVNCASSCPPCKMACEQKCVHSRCRHKCGFLCTPCKEICDWRCAHYKCSKTCGDFCDRPLCNEPCPKKLKCGHPCVGLCGEICPPLCRVCNNEDLTEIYFGNEADEDARFIFLPDCKHSIEVGAMDQWMNMDDGGQIKPKCCPRCKTIVQTCPRYGDIIKRILQDIAIVKRRILNEQAVNSSTTFLESTSKKYGTMMQRIQALAADHTLEKSQSIGKILNGGLRLIFNEALKKNKKGNYLPLSEEKRFYLKASLDFFSSVIEIFHAIPTATTIARNQERGKRLLRFNPTGFTLSMEPMTKELTEILILHIVQLVELFSSSNRLSPHDYSQFVQETDRIDYLRAYYALQSTSAFQARRSSLEEKTVLEKFLVSNVQALTDIQKTEIESTLEKLAKNLRTGIGITKKERDEILGAMQLTKGHWFKCPNGHIYAIGDCGGAMVESRCNECHAPIGGANHALLRSNSLAPEMDGATRPAWS